jgi:hypothetical protein
MRYAIVLLCVVLVLGGGAGAISVQAPLERLPPLKGASEEQARERLERRGFRNVTTQVTSATVRCPEDGDDGVAPGLVCGSVPSTSRALEIPLDTPVMLIVQGQHLEDDPYGIPPRVLGMPLAEAVAVLARHRFTNLTYEFREYPLGASGTACRPNRICALYGMLPDGRWGSDRSHRRIDPLAITVGTAFPGRRLEGEMISVIGDTLETALRKLDEAGVRGSITRRNRACPQTAEEIPAGRICDQRPAAGTRVSGLHVEYVIAGESR